MAGVARVGVTRPRPERGGAWALPVRGEVVIGGLALVIGRGARQGGAGPGHGGVVQVVRVGRVAVRGEAPPSSSSSSFTGAVAGSRGLEQRKHKKEDKPYKCFLKVKVKFKVITTSMSIYNNEDY